MTNIGDLAFSGCKGLKNVLFGNSLNKIGHVAFSFCPLNNVVYTTNTPPEGAVYGTLNYVPYEANYNTSHTIIPIIKIEKSSCIYGETISKLDWVCNLPNFTTVVTMPKMQYNAGNYDGFCKAEIKTEGFESTIDVFYEYCIEKKTLTIKADDKEIVYGDEIPILTYSYAGFVNDESENSLIAKPLISTEADKLSSVGQYKITLSGAESNNYAIDYKDGTLLKKKAELLISAADTTKIYGNRNPKFTCAYEGFVNNETENVLITSLTISTNANEFSPVGNYAIIPTGAQAHNYDIKYKNGVLTVTKAPLHATVGDMTKVYGEENPEFTITYAGFVPTDAGLKSLTPVTYSTDATKQSGAGQYAISASGASFKNYDVVDYTDGMLTITKAPLTIIANNATRLYFDNDPEFDYTCSGLVNADTKDSLLQGPSFSTNSTKNSNVGTYTITPHDAKSDNYEITYNPGVLTISKRSLSIQAADMSRKYGDKNPQWQFVYVGFVNGESETVLSIKPSATTSASSLSQVGEYAIIPTGAQAHNYDIKYKNGVLTVTKAPLHATVGNVAKVYGEENPEFTITYAGFVPTDTGLKSLTPVTYSTEATKQSGAGQYAISASGASFKNYDVVDYTDGTLTISQAALAIKANDANRLYFDDNPEFTFTCTGFVNGDNEKCLSKMPMFITDCEKNSDAGIYNITPSGAVSENYELTYASGKLTVNKRSLIAKASNTTREYGDSNPIFKIQYDGFVNNETEADLISVPTLSCAANSQSGIGNYDINIIGGNATNYDISCEKGILSITKAPLQVYVNDCSKDYGQQNPKFTTRYEGLKNNETVPAWNSAPTYSTDATEKSDVGTYRIKLLNGDAKNYDIMWNDGTLTINKAELLIKASNISRLYYEENPVFTYTCKGFKNSDNETVFLKEPSLECPATLSSNAGEYSISVSGADCKNYSLTYENGCLTINKQTLTVLPNDVSRKYEEENPSFTYNIKGFVNNEDANVLLHAPVVYTNATSLSDVGVYPLYAKDAEAVNYSFNYQKGALTIEKADQTITWNQEFGNIHIGDQVELLATTSSGLNVEYVFDTDIVALYSVGNSVYLDCLSEGTFPIRATQSGNKNYNAAVRIAKTITIADPSGISSIYADSYTNPVYYDLTGKRVAIPQKGKYYICINKGKSQKVLIK